MLVIACFSAYIINGYYLLQGILCENTALLVHIV